MWLYWFLSPVSMMPGIPRWLGWRNWLGWTSPLRELLAIQRGACSSNMLSLGSNAGIWPSIMFDIMFGFMDIKEAWNCWHLYIPASIEREGGKYRNVCSVRVYNLGFSLLWAKYYALQFSLQVNNFYSVLDYYMLYYIVIHIIYYIILYYNIILPLRARMYAL